MAADLACVLCNETFNDKEGLQEHFRTHGMKKTTQNPDISTNTSSSSSSSEKVVTYTAPSHCEICDVPCPSVRFYWHHFRTFHPDWRGVDCAHCGKHFLHNADYVRHCAVHEGLSEDKVYKCGRCSSTFYNQEALAAHSGGHEQVLHIQNKLRNPPTGKRDKIPNALKLKASFCKACQCQFANSTALAQHLVTHRLFMCLVCGKEMSDDQSFQNHQKVHLASTSCKSLGTKRTKATSSSSATTQNRSPKSKKRKN